MSQISPMADIVSSYIASHFAGLIVFFTKMFVPTPPKTPPKEKPSS